MPPPASHLWSGPAKIPDCKVLSWLASGSLQRSGGLPLAQPWATHWAECMGTAIVPAGSPWTGPEPAPMPLSPESQVGWGLCVPQKAPLQASAPLPMLCLLPRRPASSPLPSLTPGIKVRPGPGACWGGGTLFLVSPPPPRTPGLLLGLISRTHSTVGRSRAVSPGAGPA